MPKAINFSDDQVKNMISLYESGKSASDLANVFACGKSTICRVLKETGVAMNRSRSISTKMTGKPGARLGARHSAETRKAMSESRKGRPGTRFGHHSPETLAKISAGTRGKNVRYTPEQRAELERLRSAMKRFVRRTLNATGMRKSIPSEQYLGYSRHELRAHLGPRPTPDAEIDHYVPVVEFFRRGVTNPAVINALPNLRWLSPAENKAKADSVPADADAVIARCYISIPDGSTRDGEVLTAKFVKQPNGRTKTVYSKGLPV